MKRTAFLCVLFSTFFGSVIAQEKLVSDKPIPIIVWADIPAAEMNVGRFTELEEIGANIALSNYSDADAMQRTLDLALRQGSK